MADSILLINKQAFSSKDVQISIVGVSFGVLETIIALDWDTADVLYHQGRIGSATAITTSRGKSEPKGSLKLQEYEITSILLAWKVSEFKYLPNNCTIRIVYNPEGENPTVVPRAEELINLRFGTTGAAITEDDGAQYRTIDFIFIKPSGPLAG